jgi:hypothetical protein
MYWEQDKNPGRAGQHCAAMCYSWKDFYRQYLVRMAHDLELRVLFDPVSRVERSAPLMETQLAVNNSTHVKTTF